MSFILQSRLPISDCFLCAQSCLGVIDSMTPLGRVEALFSTIVFIVLGILCKECVLKAKEHVLGVTN